MVARRGQYEYPTKECLLFFYCDNINRILHMRRRECVITVELHRHLHPTDIHGQLAQRRLHWYGYAARHPDGELIRDSVFLHRLVRGAGEVKPAEDVGDHNQVRSGTPLRIVSLWIRTMENGQGQSL